MNKKSLLSGGNTRNTHTHTRLSTQSIFGERRPKQQDFTAGRFCNAAEKLVLSLSSVTAHSQLNRGGLYSDKQFLILDFGGKKGEEDCV